MGQAKVKLMEASIKVNVNFDKIPFNIGKSDREAFSKDEGEVALEKVNLRVSRYTLTSVISTLFKEGMNRHDRKNWAAWQECFSEDELTEVEVTVSMVRWLRDKISFDGLLINPGLAQWVESLIDYFTEVIDSAHAD